MQSDETFSDRLIQVGSPFMVDNDWWFCVHGLRSSQLGPFTSQRAARLYREHLFQKWKRVAIERCGWFWKKTDEQWIATIPTEKRPFGVLFRGEVTTKHHSV